jgi:hypothetical protein
MAVNLNPDLPGIMVVAANGIKEGIKIIRECIRDIKRDQDRQVSIRAILYSLRLNFKKYNAVVVQKDLHCSLSFLNDIVFQEEFELLAGNDSFKYEIICSF